MIVVTVIAAVGGLLFGFDTGIISGALVFLQDSFVLSTFAKECIVASVVLGALMGSLCSGFVADHFGRRKMLILSSGVFLLGTALASFAQSVAVLVVGRLLLGLAIGVSSYTVPLYISEMAPAQRRGQLVLLSSIAITGGEALAFLSDYWLAPSASWRWMFALGFIPAALLLLGMLWLPATPRWLLLKGREQQARTVLQRLRKQMAVAQELESIRQQCQQRQASWRELFAKPWRGVVLLGVLLGVLQQFTGINTVMYYGPFIFKAAGFPDAQNQLMATFILGMVNTLMTIVAVCSVDRFGRRRLLINGMVLSMVCLAVVGALFRQSTIWAQWMMVLGLMGYIAGYAISLGSMFWLIIAEIYPLHLRTRAMSFVTAVQWAANFIVAVSFLTILDHIGASMTFWLYGLMCFITIGFAYFWVPETRQVSLERIQDNVSQGCRLRDIGA